MAEQKKQSSRKKLKVGIKKGIVHIKSTFNNTIITVSDPEGRVIATTSAGAVGYKGSKKSTPFAARVAATTLGEKLKNMGIKEIDIFVKGPGAGREAAIRSLQSFGFYVNVIKDVTPIPHNGCRPKKRRRV